MAPIPSQTQTGTTQKEAPADTALDTGRFLLGTGLLGIASAFAGLLTYQQLAGAAIPGCGPGSACGELAASVWGRVPFVDWPVSFLGFAFFAGLLVAWIAVRGQAGPVMRWMIRLGAAASIMFLGVMVTKGMICMYCLGAHVANLAFVTLVEVTARRGATAPARQGARQLPWQGISAAAIVFLTLTLGIAVAQQQVEKSLTKRQEAELAASTQELLRAQEAATQRAARAAEREAATTPAAPTTPTPEPDPDPEPREVAETPESPATPATPTTPPEPVQPVAQQQTQQAQQTQAQPQQPAPGTRRGFTGRYRWGPEKAPVRIVMFTGYQCPDCQTLDQQVKEILARWPGQVAYSVKHFPLSSACNPHMRGSNPHPNACWAARAAEAAGMLGGFEGFERMHNWLYQQRGSFTDSSLPPALRRLNFDPVVFQQVMVSPETLRLVQEDIEEGIAYGLSQTPMIFINGVELKGWRAPNALVRTVEQLMATNPEPRGPEYDRPPGALEKAIADWQEQPVQPIDSRMRVWGIGPSNAPVRIHVFGDYLEENAGNLHRAVMAAIRGRDDVRYEFRYFPLEQSCNPNLPRNITEGGCRAARAAEAAGQLGGEQAFWKMHDWLMANRERFSDQTLRAAANEMGLMGDALLAALDTPQVRDAVQQDITAGNRLGAPRMVRLHINGRLAPRWEIPGEDLLGLMIEEAKLQQ